MIKHIKENWKTTMVGIILILGGIVTVCLKVTDWPGATAIIMTGVGLACASDSKTAEK